MLKAENIKLNKNFIWHMLEIDWKEVTVTLSENNINLPRIVTFKLQEKIKIVTINEKRIFTLSLHAETRDYMVYFGHRHTRNCINSTTK